MNKETLQQELEDIKETHKNIMEEKCASDEVHCTCVPALRIGLDKANEEIVQLKKRASVEEIEKIIRKPKHRTDRIKEIATAISEYIKGKRWII